MSQTHTFTTPNRLHQVALSALLGVALSGSLGCSISASGPLASSVQADQAALATGIVPARFFGMVVKNPALQPPTIQVGARRLWDSGVSWAQLEPARGTFVWTTLDAEVAAAEQAGAAITLTLGMTPSWASSNPAATSSYGAGATVMPADLGDWDAYVAAIAARYSGRIQAYEVWNAPENAAYWTGSTVEMGENMAALAAHAAAAVRAADPAALVVSPAMSATGLAAFLAAGGAASVDVIGTALGSTADADAPFTPEAAVTMLRQLREAMSGTTAAGKPVGNEQASWALPQGGIAPDVQASYVARALLINAGFGVQRVQWYAWDEAGPGTLTLSDPQGAATEAAGAYAMVESWLAGASMNGCASTAGGVWTCQITRAAKAEWILWSPAGMVSSSSSLGASTATDLHGVVTAVDSSGRVSVGAAPVLLQ